MFLASFFVFVSYPATRSSFIYALILFIIPAHYFATPPCTTTTVASNLLHSVAEGSLTRGAWGRGKKGGKTLIQSLPLGGFVGVRFLMYFPVPNFGHFRPLWRPTVPERVDLGGNFVAKRIPKSDGKSRLVKGRFLIPLLHGIIAFEV